MNKLTLGCLALVLMTSAAAAAMPGQTANTTAGKVYIDSKGMTLYVFDKDKANKSNCYKACAETWPPYLAEAKAKAEGPWSLIKRKDGSKMWAYKKHPLYTYIKDTKPGDVTGNGVGGVWHVAKSG